MEPTSKAKSEITKWLKTALKRQRVENFNVEIHENTENICGFSADIIFIRVQGTDEDGTTKEYNFALKCSKESQVLRETFLIADQFLSEKWFYESLIPTFDQFKRDKGVEDSFDSIAKYYGTFISINKEVIILENLNTSRYYLWDCGKPLSRRHLELVIEEYGKFHAISTAIKQQKPEVFNDLLKGLLNVFKKLRDTTEYEDVIGDVVDEIYDLLRDDLDKNILLKWQNLKKQKKYILYDLVENENHFNVVTHSDCSNNNYMFYYDSEDKIIPSKVAILDWQKSIYSSPVLDLSQFLFSSISKEDLKDMESFLEKYYKSFSSYLKILGNDSETIYPYKQFLQDWSRCSRYGIFMSILPIKLTFSEPENIDIVKAVEDGIDIARAFSVKVVDKVGFRNRIIYHVQYAVKNNLI